MTGPRLGAHMSIAGGPANALRRGHSIHCDAIQMFTRNANQWVSKDLTAEQVAEFHEARRETGIDEVVAHSSYLINLATPDDALARKSYAALLTELERCAQLGIDRYVLHPGSHRAAGEEEGLRRVGEALNQALAATDDSVSILLENTAGQGSALGHSLEHLAWLLEHCAPTRRLGVCFDTAHALAAGYALGDVSAYEGFWQRFEALIGRERLRCIHLNDSKSELGSRVDRHAHIGEGHVGLETFRLLVNDGRLYHAPMLLETPKDKDLSEDIRNLATLRGLVGRRRPVTTEGEQEESAT